MLLFFNSGLFLRRCGDTTACVCVCGGGGGEQNVNQIGHVLCECNIGILERLRS